MKLAQKPVVLASLLLFAKAALAEDYDVLTYASPDGVYEFDYPSFYHESHEFADGTGDLDGIRSELEGSLESNIGVYAMDVRGVKDVDEKTYPAYVEQYKTDFATDPRMIFISDAAAQLFGQMAADIRFQKKGYGKMHGMRFVGTVVHGKDMFVQCSYTLEAEETFGPVCDFVAQSLRFVKQ